MYESFSLHLYLSRFVGYARASLSYLCAGLYGSHSHPNAIGAVHCCAFRMFVSEFIKIIEFDIWFAVEQVRTIFQNTHARRGKIVCEYKMKNKQEHEQLSDEFECLSRRRTDMNANMPEYEDKKTTKQRTMSNEEEEGIRRTKYRKEIK